MKFVSIEPFVPSGPDLEGSKQLFQELGFEMKWDAGDYSGFERDGCKFILQKYNNKEFAENFMLSVRVSNVHELQQELLEKQLEKKFGIRIGQITSQPYGKELNIIDMAGVCWHFIE